MTTPTEVVKLMESSTSADEWNANCDKVKKANGGGYPSFWYATIVSSGVAATVQAKWSRDSSNCSSTTSALRSLSSASASQNSNMKTNPHSKPLTWQPCNSFHLIIVGEGVQCSNCLALVIDRRTPEPNDQTPEDRPTH